ncbi:MAG: type II secretion system protein [Chloroflexota bacterium]
MKSAQKGFTLVELIIAVSIMALTSTAAGAAIFQVMRNIDINNDYVVVVNQVENAGYWISRDAQMATNISTDNLTPPYFLVIDWAEWDAAGDPTYHSASYFFEGLANGVGRLKRTHSGGGANQTTLVATYIYYNPGDNITSSASYISPLLTLKLTSRLEKATETKEYKINQRINLITQ